MWVTADDYGLHPDINRGIRHCVELGLVNSVSVGVCGEAADAAELEALREMQSRIPGLDVGVHLMLTEASPLTSCRSCVGEDGCFLRHSTHIARRALLGLVKPKEVESEWREQIERALQAGLRLGHLDSHQHVHLLPGLWAVYRALSRRHGISRIRCGYESLLRSLLRAKPAYAAMQLLALPRYLTLVPRVRTLGILVSCAFRFDRIEPQVRHALRAGRAVEIMVHPGFETPELTARFGYWKADWDREIEELRALRRFLDGQGYPRFCDPSTSACCG